MKQFSRTGADGTTVNIASNATLAAAIAAGADFSFGFTMNLNGDTTLSAGSHAFQVPFHTGSSGVGGTLNAQWYPTDTGTSNAGKLYLILEGNTSLRCPTPALEAGKIYDINIVRSSGVITTRTAEVTAIQPTDGSSVTVSAGENASGALTFPGGLNIGYGAIQTRRLDHALSRLYLLPRALTNFEIAQKAWGKEITAFGTPLIYLRMNDAADTANTGSLAASSPSTAGGTLSAPDPAYGFSSVPTPPTFATPPQISGNAVVGQTVGYTGGNAVGNPSPAVTRQWTTSTTLAGAQTAIANAIDATYSLTSAENGKYLRLKLRADNGLAPAAETTSDPVLVSSTAVGVTLTSVKSESIYQCEAGGINGRAVVPLSGGYVGAQPARVEAQVYAVDGTTIVRSWFDVGATYGNSTWSATPTIDAPTDGQKYRIAVRSLNGSSVTIASTPISDRFGVGDRIPVIGSSSPATWFTNGSGANKTPDHNKVSTIYDAGDSAKQSWGLFDSYGQASSMAEYIVSKTGRPCALIKLAEGGTSLAEWARVESGGLWGRVRALLNFMGVKLGGLWGSAGSNDIISPSAAQTVEQHLLKLQAVRDLIRGDTGQPNLPILWSGINRRYDALPLQANNARQAERLFGDEPNVYYVQTLDIEVKDPAAGGDGIHPTGAGYTTCARRIEYVWTEGVIYGRKQRGPVIAGISFAGARVTMAVQYRNTGANDLVAVSGTTGEVLPLSAAKGFTVTDTDGAGGRVVVPIASVERADSSHLSLVCDRVLIAPRLTYLDGAWVDRDAPVFDNAPTALPLMAEPFATTSVAEPDVTAPTWSAGALVASNATTNSGTLTWPAANDSVGIAGYEYSINGGATYIGVAANVRTVNLSQLTSATAYPCRVRAFDDAQNRSAPLTATLTTLASGGGGTPAPTPTRTVSLTLVLGKDANNNDIPAANLAGVMVGFRLGSGPHNSGAALYQSSAETTDANGVLSFTFQSDAIGAGQSGVIEVLMPDGKNFLGLAAVA